MSMVYLALPLHPPQFSTQFTQLYWRAFAGAHTQYQPRADQCRAICLHHMVDSFINGPTARVTHNPLQSNTKPSGMLHHQSVCSNGIHVDHKALAIMQLSAFHSIYCMCYLLFHYLYVYLQCIHLIHRMIWKGRSEDQAFLLLLFLWQM